MRAVIFDIDHTLFTAEQAAHSGVQDLLQILRRLGIAIGGISGDDHRALVRLDEAGLGHYFDKVLCADQAFEPKETAGLHHLLSLLGARPEDSTLVSHAHSDILLGKDAALGKTIGVTHGHSNVQPLVEAGADHIIQDIPAVLDVLE
ncbi:MAG TPA: HAD family hydrolase [Candidatus Saccharimonadales bacterium]|nr:HAD family hydrolase [Candidatus Saccharimonadales bacterium]